MPVFINGVEQGTGGGDVVDDTTPQLGGDLDANGFDISGIGHVGFLASQDPSAGANDLDDYEEGTWTPVLTFATVGDLSVVYSGQVGHYTKIGQMVYLMFSLNLSTFTHSTASGALQITGVPFVSANVSLLDQTGPLSWDGVTKANYTNLVLFLPANSSTMNLRASGSGQNATSITASDTPTGGSVLGQGSILYRV